MSLIGSNQIIKDALAELLEQVLGQAGISRAQVACFAAAGMITSEIGLREVPHLCAPAGAEELGAGIFELDCGGFLGCSAPVCLIPGIKNTAERGLSRLDRMDFMRGEETQVCGVLACMGCALPAWIFVAGSHTKLIAVDRDGKIRGSVTNLSGQLYEAVLNQTFIGKCLKDQPGDVPAGMDRQELEELAFTAADRGGLLRAVLMPRFMEVLAETSAGERKTFLDAALAWEDLKLGREAVRLGFDPPEEMVVVSTPERSRLLCRLLKRHHPGTPIREIISREETARITVEGALAILRAGKRRCDL